MNQNHRWFRFSSEEIISATPKLSKWTIVTVVQHSDVLASVCAQARNAFPNFEFHVRKCVHDKSARNSPRCLMFRTCSKPAFSLSGGNSTNARLVNDERKWALLMSMTMSSYDLPYSLSTIIKLVKRRTASNGGIALMTPSRKMLTLTWWTFSPVATSLDLISTRCPSPPLMSIHFVPMGFVFVSNQHCSTGTSCKTADLSINSSSSRLALCTKLLPVTLTQTLSWSSAVHTMGSSSQESLRPVMIAATSFFGRTSRRSLQTHSTFSPIIAAELNQVVGFCDAVHVHRHVHNMLFAWQLLDELLMTHTITFRTQDGSSHELSRLWKKGLFACKLRVWNTQGLPPGRQGSLDLVPRGQSERSPARVVICLREACASNMRQLRSAHQNSSPRTFRRGKGMFFSMRSCFKSLWWVCSSSRPWFSSSFIQPTLFFKLFFPVTAVISQSVLKTKVLLFIMLFLAFKTAVRQSVLFGVLLSMKPSDALWWDLDFSGCECITLFLKKKTSLDRLKDRGVVATFQSHTQPVLVRPTKVTRATRVSEESFLFLWASNNETGRQNIWQPKTCHHTLQKQEKNIQTCSHQQVVPAQLSHHIPLPTVTAHPRWRHSVALQQFALHRWSKTPLIFQHRQESSTATRLAQ